MMAVSYKDNYSPRLCQKRVGLQSFLWLVCCFLSIRSEVLAEEHKTAWIKTIENYEITLHAETPEKPVIEIFGPETEKITSFFLQEPARFVVDLPGKTSKPLNDSVKVDQTSLVEKVRIASHSTYTRLVFDLTSHEEPLLQKSSTHENIRFALNSTAISQIAENREVEDKTGEASMNFENLELTDVFESEGAAEKQKTNLATVSNIQFIRLTSSQEGLIRIELSESRPFELTQTGDESYRLTISDAESATAQTLKTLYAPSDFTSFLLLQPEQLDGQLAIKINVPEGVRLEARPKETSIWIRGTVPTTNK
jgi:hypothetical protein